jgi:hypothetical protein
MVLPSSSQSCEWGECQLQDQRLKQACLLLNCMTGNC